MSTSYVPEFCTVEDINAGIVALLSACGVQAADELTIKSVEVRDGKLQLEIMPNNKTGGAIAVGIDVPTIWAEIRVRND